MSQQDNEPQFREPWQAQALATALSLQEAGVISEVEWSAALGAAIKCAQANGDADLGDTYYEHVLNALETLLQAKGLVPGTELAVRKSQWEQAYRNTPHGQPVNLPSHNGPAPSD